jgi:hypothetical protein
MSFTDKNLPDFLIADLYKTSLVLVDNDLPIKTKPKTTTIVSEEFNEPQIPEVPLIIAKKAADEPLAFLGNNGKRISIVVKDDHAIHLQDELLHILSAILGACKLNLADVAIINTQTQEVNDVFLRRDLSPKNVLLFGVTTTEIDLPFSIPDYKVQAFNNCNYLQAASLIKMKGATNEAKVEKSKLWVCLKTLFGI